MISGTDVVYEFDAADIADGSTIQLYSSADQTMGIHFKIDHDAGDPYSVVLGFEDDADFETYFSGWNGQAEVYEYTQGDAIRSHWFWKFTTATAASSGDTTSWDGNWSRDETMTVENLDTHLGSFTLNWQYGVDPATVVDEESTGGSGALLWIIIGVLVVGGAAAAYFLM